MRTAIVLVLDDEVRDLAKARAELDPESARKLPFHLTLLFPFVPRAELDEGVLAGLRRFFAAQPAPVFALARVGLLAGTWAYAAPDPVEPLEGLLHRLWARYPELPPYEGEIADPVPHATLLRVEPAAAESELGRIERRVSTLLPAACAPREAALLEELQDGSWRQLEALPFARAAA